MNKCIHAKLSSIINEMQLIIESLTKPKKRGRPKKNAEICIKQSEINHTVIGKEESKKATRTTDQQKTEQPAGFLVEYEMLLDE